MNTQQEYEQLKRQNRRRLVGATVVVILAAIVLISVLNSGLSKQEIKIAQITIGDNASLETIQSENLVNPMHNTASEPVEIIPAPPEEPDDAVKDIPPSRQLNHEQDAITVPNVVDDNKQATNSKNISIQTEVKKEVKPEVKKEVKPEVKKEVKPTKKTTQLSPREILEGKAGKDIKIKAEHKNNNTSTHPQSILEGEPRKNQDIAKSQRMLIQVGAFVDESQANGLKQKLQALGVPAQIHKAMTSKGEVSRVRVGPYTTRIQAESALAKIKSAGLDGIIVPQ